MKKTIRSISIMESLDNNLKEDSEIRGLTISANISRILYGYFQKNSIELIKERKKLNLLPTIKQK
jgi:hypothetical protein